MIHPGLKRKQQLTFISTLILLMLAIVWNLTTGEYAMSYGQIIQTFLGQGDAADRLILIDFRLPRVVITLLAGIALSMSGAVLQSVTKILSQNRNFRHQCRKWFCYRVIRLFRSNTR